MMLIMNPLSWILLGLITGIGITLTHARPSTDDLVGATLLGISGAIIGGLFASLLLGQDLGGFSIVSLLLAAAGSMMLLSFKKGGTWTLKKGYGV